MSAPNRPEPESTTNAQSIQSSTCSSDEEVLASKFVDPQLQALVDRFDQLCHQHDVLDDAVTRSEQVIEQLTAAENDLLKAKTNDRLPHRQQRIHFRGRNQRSSTRTT